jgi:hypothetical protein
LVATGFTSSPAQTLSKLPDISKLSGALIDSVGKVDGVLKESIASIVGLTVPSSGAYTPPLDTYTGATAAYSVRKLSSTYSGSCIEAYRVSDGATQDIGFDADGLIDTAAIVTFASGGEVRVRTWYDQSGNGFDGVQSTSANQPIIYDGSALIEDNGIAAIRFKNQDNTGVNRWFDAGDNGDTTGDISVFSVLNHRNSQLSLNLGGPVTKTKAAVGASRWAIQPTRIIYVDTSNTVTDITNTTTQDTQILFSAIAIGGSSITMYENGTAEPNTASPSGSAGDNSQHLLIGAYGDSSGLGGAADSMRGVMQEAIYYASDRSSNLLDLNANLSTYYQIANLPATSSGLLYDYPGAAAAYSVRSLNNNAVKCMRVRRSVSPFDEQDIGFDSNGDLDTAAIAAFGGSDPLKLSAWYDQSGEQNDATQATAGEQPTIYDGSAVITSGTKPAIQFATSSANQTIQLEHQFATAQSQPITGVFVARDITTSTNEQAFLDNFGPGAQDFFGLIIDGDGTIVAGTNGAGGANYDTGVSADADMLLTQVWDGANGETFKNATSIGSGNTGTVNQTGITIGGLRPGINNRFAIHGNMQEVIVWNSNQDTAGNRTAIESNINTYYSIY